MLALTGLSGRRRLASVTYPAATPGTGICTNSSNSYILQQNDGSPYSGPAVAAFIGPFADFPLPLTPTDSNGSYLGSSYYCRPTNSSVGCAAVLHDRHNFCSAWDWWSLPNIASTVTCNTSMSAYCTEILQQAAAKDTAQCQVWTQYDSGAKINSFCSAISSTTGRRRLLQELIEIPEIFSAEELGVPPVEPIPWTPEQLPRPPPFIPESPDDPPPPPQPDFPGSPDRIEFPRPVPGPPITYRQSSCHCTRCTGSGFAALGCAIAYELCVASCTLQVG